MKKKEKKKRKEQQQQKQKKQRSRALKTLQGDHFRRRNINKLLMSGEESAAQNKFCLLRRRSEVQL